MTYSEYMSGEGVTLAVSPTAPERIEEDTRLPVTPAEIATAVDECSTAGATIASVYGWSDDAEQTPSALSSVATAVREEVEDVLVEYAVGPDCRLGDYLDALEADPVPDLAQVRVTPDQYGTRGVTRRNRRDVDRFIDELSERGIRPDLLIQSGRDVQELYRLLQSDIVTEPVVTLRLGARDGTVATPLTLLALLDALPEAATALVGATGPNQYPLTTMGLFMGAHVRVGMADNRYLHRDEPVEHNRQLVDRAVATIERSTRAVSDFEATERTFATGERRIEAP
jgi:3-keto-5-aminohexanoate cleavage enzyme